MVVRRDAGGVDGFEHGPDDRKIEKESEHVRAKGEAFGSSDLAVS